MSSTSGIGGSSPSLPAIYRAALGQPSQDEPFKAPVDMMGPVRTSLRGDVDTFPPSSLPSLPSHPCRRIVETLNEKWKGPIPTYL